MIVGIQKKQVIIFFMIISPQKDEKAITKIDMFQSFIRSSNLQSGNFLGTFVEIGTNDSYFNHRMIIVNFM